MSPVYASRRRADEFQVLLERGGASEHADSPLADLLVLVEGLRAVEPAMPRADFSASLRERLMTAAEAELAAGSVESKLAMPPRRTKRERRIAAAVGGLALVGASTGLAAAAQTALPGDALYPLKRAIENAQTGLSRGDEAKGSTLLANAQDRLDELSRLTARGDDPETVSATLDDFTDQATQASDLLLADYAQSGHASSIAELRDFTASSLDSLAALAPQVDGTAHDSLVHAADVLTQIDDAAAAACPSCGGQGIGDLPAILVAAGLRTPTPSAPPSVPSTTLKASGASDGGTKQGGKKGGPKSGSGSTTTSGSDGSDDPLTELGQTVTGGSGSGSTSNGGGSGGGGGLLPGLPSSTDTSSGDPVGGLGDAIDDTVSGIGDALTP